MERCKHKLHFPYYFTVDYMGRRGGLALLWKGDLYVCIQFYSRNHIDALIKNGDKPEWRFIGIYGYPKVGNRFMTWDLIRRLSSGVVGSWLVGVDFSKILHSNEKAHSDHLPMWFEFKAMEDRTRSPKQFWFKAMWMGEEKCS